MRQLTIRGVDQELERALTELAGREGISLNRAALRLLRRGAGLTDADVRVRPIGNRLAKHFGTWTEAEAEELRRAIAPLEEIDEELWK